MKACPQCQVKYPDVLEFCPRDGSPLPQSAAASAASYDPMIGTTIDGRYAIEARLGDGGMGVVYKARHVLIDKPVAIKILRKEAAQDSASVQRFIQEAKSASKINHSNIVDITDFGVLSDGHAYFVMEFLQGKTLAQIIQEGPVEAVRVCNVAAQMARGLHAAHQKNIVHRDLKPENVFLLEKEEQKDFVKVVDFGIAREITAKQRLTQVGMVLGTPEYMSPEQATGQEIDHRVDQYALGCIMYELLTGTVPFQGERPAQTLTKHVFEAVVPPRQRKPDLNIPASLEAVVMRTLAKKPPERYPSMRELETALLQVEAELRGGRVMVDDARLFSGRMQLPQSGPMGTSEGHQGLVDGLPAQLGGGYGPQGGPMVSEPQGVVGDMVYPGGPGQFRAGVPGHYQPSQSSGPIAAGVMGSGALALGPAAQAMGYGMSSQRVLVGHESRPTIESTPAKRARNLRSVLAAVVGALVVLIGLLAHNLLSERTGAVETRIPDLSSARAVAREPPSHPAEPVVKKSDPVPLAPHLTSTTETVQITVRSLPKGATVFVNGERLGAAPRILSRTRGTTFQLELRKTGYQPYTEQMRAESSLELPITLMKRSERPRARKGSKEAARPPPQPLRPTVGTPPKTSNLRNPFSK